jgi:hypothetical protein
MIQDNFDRVCRQICRRANHLDHRHGYDRGRSIVGSCLDDPLIPVELTDCTRSMKFHKLLLLHST